MKALHPATEVVGPLTGVPDLDTQNSLTFEWRQTNTIPAPTGLTAGDTWDVDVVSMPGPGLFAIYRRKKTVDNWGITNTLVLNDQYNWGSTEPTVGANGVISGGSVGNWPADVRLARAMYHSMTIVTNAASLTDQGMMVSGQIPALYETENVGSVVGDNGGTAPLTVRGRSDPSNWNYATCVSRAPDFDTLLQTCPKSEMRRARDGVYIPTRFTDGQFLWQTSRSMVYNGDGPWGGGSAAAWTVDPTFRPVPQLTRMNHGVVCYRGLAPTTSLTMFTRCGVEGAVEATSNFRPFVTPSCAPDMTMIQEYFKLSSMLSETYDSSYNEKDILTSIITELASSLGKPWDKILPLIFKGGKKAMKGRKGKPGKETAAITEALEDEGATLSDTTTTKTKKKAAKGPIPRPKPVQKTVSKATKKK